MKVVYYPKDIEDLANGFGHEVGLFLRSRNLMDDEESFKVAKEIAAAVEREIYSAMGIKGAA